jgi:hypothetical protein
MAENEILEQMIGQRVVVEGEAENRLDGAHAITTTHVIKLIDKQAWLGTEIGLPVRVEGTLERFALPRQTIIDENGMMARGPEQSTFALRDYVVTFLP